MLKRLATAAATIAMTFAGATAVANADETTTPKAAAAGVCGYSDDLYVGSTHHEKDAHTCRWISDMGTLNNYASYEDVARGDIYHHVGLENFSGRDIHLGFYRQGMRNGRWQTYTWRYNALVPRGEQRIFSSEYNGYYYSSIRGIVKHHGSGRTIYTPWINLKQCTGPGGDC